MAAPRDDLEGQAATVAGYHLFAVGVKIASFAEGRIGYPEWARRNHSLDDRYDHDVDEMMA